MSNYNSPDIRQCFVPCKIPNGEKHKFVFEIHSDSPIVSLKFDLENGGKYKLSCFHADTTCTDSPFCTKTDKNRKIVKETRKINKMDNKRLSWAENEVFSPWASKTEIAEKSSSKTEPKTEEKMPETKSPSKSNRRFSWADVDVYSPWTTRKSVNEELDQDKILEEVEQDLAYIEEYEKTHPEERKMTLDTKPRPSFLEELKSKQQNLKKSSIKDPQIRPNSINKFTEKNDNVANTVNNFDQEEKRVPFKVGDRMSLTNRFRPGYGKLEKASEPTEVEDDGNSSDEYELTSRRFSLRYSK